MPTLPSYTLMLSLRGSTAHLRLLRDEELVLRATLPAPAQFWTGKPVKALLESLAIWLDAKLLVVFDAAEPADGFMLELTDEVGTGLRTLFYDVEPIDRRHRRTRAQPALGHDGVAPSTEVRP
jgi:hypothetical protein